MVFQDVKVDYFLEMCLYTFPNFLLLPFQVHDIVK